MHRTFIGLAAVCAASSCPAARAADWYTGGGGARRSRCLDRLGGRLRDRRLAGIAVRERQRHRGARGQRQHQRRAPAGRRPDRLLPGGGPPARPAPSASRRIWRRWPVTRWSGESSVLAGFVGVNVRRDETSHFDASVSAVRTEVGLKTALDYYARPTELTMFHATGSYATTFNAYFGRMRFGFASVAGGYIGPELAALGDDNYRQWRAGAHLSGMQFGALQLGVSAGYVHDHVRKGGLYTTLDLRTGF